MKRLSIARVDAGEGRRAFTLLEIIVVVAILSLMAGAAVPVANKMLQSQLRKATRAELERLGDAALEYFRDTNNAPRAISDFEVDPHRPDAKGWSGPYLSGAVPDPRTGRSNYEVDAWSRDYVLERGARLSIGSLGPDGLPGGVDDIAITVDFTPIRRERTLDRLRIINQAVFLYNGQFQTTAPLPADYAAALSLLVRRGLLPEGAEYRKDAWGVELVADPEGRAPLVRVKSKSM